MHFTTRKEAGKKLAQELTDKIGNKSIVLGLARGGMPVAREIAKKLNLELDVIVVRKIGSPMQPEYGLGALSEAGTLVLDKDRMSGLSKDDLQDSVSIERKELKRRAKLYRKGKSLNLIGKDVILVDDGLATGVTARAAAIAAKKLGAKKIIFAAPVCALKSIPELMNHVDRVVCLIKPESLGAIGAFYESFEQVSDKEVIKTLSSASFPD